MSTFTERLGRVFGREVIGLLGLFALTVIAFSLTSPHFLSIGNFDSIGFQLPDLGLLTLAMLAPIIANGINSNPIFVSYVAASSHNSPKASINRGIGVFVRSKSPTFT